MSTQDTTANIIVRFRDEFSAQARNLEHSVKGLGGAFESIKKALVGLGAAYGLNEIVKGVAELAKRGDEVYGVTTQFEMLAKQAGIVSDVFKDDLRNATENTISDFDLMQIANKAMISDLGASEKQMAQLADGAFKLSKAIGVDARQALADFNEAIERQMDRGLKAYGIQVDVIKANEDYARSIGKSVAALTEQEKRAAFLNATLTALKDTTSKFGELQDTAGDAIEKLSAAWVNFKDSLATSDGWLSKITKDLSEMITVALDFYTKWGTKSEQQKARLIELREEIKKTKDEVAYYDKLVSKGVRDAVSYTDPSEIVNARKASTDAQFKLNKLVEEEERLTKSIANNTKVVLKNTKDRIPYIKDSVDALNLIELKTIAATESAKYFGDTWDDSVLNLNASINNLNAPLKSSNDTIKLMVESTKNLQDYATKVAETFDWWNNSVENADAKINQISESDLYIDYSGQRQDTAMQAISAVQSGPEGTIRTIGAAAGGWAQVIIEAVLAVIQFMKDSKQWADFIQDAMQKIIVELNPFLVEFTYNLAYGISKHMDIIVEAFMKEFVLEIAVLLLSGGLVSRIGWMVTDALIRGIVDGANKVEWDRMITKGWHDWVNKFDKAWQDILDNTKGVFVNWWRDNANAFFKDIGNVIDYWTQSLKTASINIESSIKNGFYDGWDKVKKDVMGLYEKIKEKIQHDFGIAKEKSSIRVGGTLGQILGSYQSGTAFVPQTGVYQLHRGEAVIPANRNSGMGNITINMNGVNVSGGNIDDFLSALSDALRNNRRGIQRDFRQALA